MWNLLNLYDAQHPWMCCFPILQIRNKATWPEASESEVRELRQYRFLTPGPASGRKRGGRKDNSSTWMSMGPMKFRSWIQEQAGPGSKAPGRWYALQRPRALAGGLVFSTYHLSPFINKHLPQEWHISKAIPSSLALASSPSPGQGAMYDKCWAASYAVSLSPCLFPQLN